jgi:hypothetical protein
LARLVAVAVMIAANDDTFVRLLLPGCPALEFQPRLRSGALHRAQPGGSVLLALIVSPLAPARALCARIFASEGREARRLSKRPGVSSGPPAFLSTLLDMNNSNSTGAPAGLVSTAPGERGAT